MSVVIKEIIVKTTVEAVKAKEKEFVIPPGFVELVKEEILRELDRHEYMVESRRKER